jgi:Polysaccharide lyase family 8, super-sandwich domain/Polysaccharide lyase family 8, N terminal alpha-helical domain
MSRTSVYSGWPMPKSRKGERMGGTWDLMVTKRSATFPQWMVKGMRKEWVEIAMVVGRDGNGRNGRFPHKSSQSHRWILLPECAFRWRVSPYNGHYGQVLLGDVSMLLPWLQGSPWQITDPAQTNVVNWVYNSCEPLIYCGGVMDMTRGRMISNNQNEHSEGHLIVEAILTLSPFAATNDTARMRSMVKCWMQADTYRGFPDGTIPDIVAFEQLATNTGVVSRGELIGHWTFGSMDEVVHLRPGWDFALSMFSSRIANYEYMNGENAHGWYTGAGMTYLYNPGDQGQISDNFWPTVD